MPTSPLGKTLLIANPAARSGAGTKAAAFADGFFSSYESATSGFELVCTAAAGEAEGIAAGAAGFDTVLALGGDGVIHEIVNGLMRIGRDTRPQLGVIPMGSGNDYARTLGMARNDCEAALAQLVRSAPAQMEVGEVNGTYFMQTLSFGLDAAIALDTTERRGEALFVTSGVRILSQAGAGFACRASFDGEKPLDLATLIFAVQVGPTYGGGFAVCPGADPSDGLLDVCYNVKRPSLPHILALFGSARWGLHARSSVVKLRRIERAVLDFEQEPPVQADGEKLRGTHFDIRVVPEALNVLVPAR